jgi:hypothetical protein
VERNLELETAAFANLDDLDSWRVFADWLLSHGDTRGEIASLAAHLGEGFLSERKRMAARMDELERPFSDAWKAWAQSHGLTSIKVDFKRGFAYGLTGSLTQLLPVMEELFERDPIQRLTLTDFQPDTLARFLDSRPPWLARLRYLKLQDKLDETAVAALAEVELTNLRRLNLLNTGIDADACEHLARLQTQRLEHFTLTANDIDQTGLAALLRSPTRGQWRELFLSGNPLDSPAPALLAADQGLALTGLYMRQTDASIGDFAPFADPTVMPTLERLEIRSWGYWQHRTLHEQLRERFGAGLLLN